MAIVVEDERRSSVNVLGLTVWIVILLIVGMGVYYLFFKRPEIIPINTPANLENAESLANIDLNPEEVLGDPVFRQLRSEVPPLSPQNVGKTNPFLGF